MFFLISTWETVSLNILINSQIYCIFIILLLFLTNFTEMNINTYSDFYILQNGWNWQSMLTEPEVNISEKIYTQI